jgi:hypothetical protein
VHGIAVSHFQLGHLLQLLYREKRDNHYKAEAIANYKKAFSEFKKLNHFLGKF